MTPLTIPAANPALRDRPFQALLIDSQTLFEAETHSDYSEMAFLIQNAQGMQGLGNISLPWQPDRSDLVVHKVHIVRNGTIIDLLAAGQHFTVLRRENNLDSAVLDGILTAVMPVEGLAIGDVLDIAFTVRRRAGVLPLRAENFVVLQNGTSIRRLHARQIWPADMPVRWRATGTLDRQARLRQTQRGSELVLDLTDAEGPRPPSMAPPRFALPSTLQVTGYRDWQDISSQLAPHYGRASELGADSPLRAEIARIASTTQDPRRRAMAALRLVQDEVRYFAVAIGDGNYLPEPADRTWARRFGDCKGKTVVLMALLRGLGIEAEPILVHSSMGDALSDRLPQIGLFDHVIVRARIDGRSYWLDGTRNGDRQIEELASSRLRWGLPLREGGAPLEVLPFAPALAPLMEERVTYDGSHGLLGEVPVSGELIYRGDFAVALRALLAQAGETEFARMMREQIQEVGSPALDITHRIDEAEGTFSVLYSGRRRMTFSGNSATRVLTFRFDNDTITWAPAFRADEGPYRDAPVLIEAPIYNALVETVILPDNGRGFSISGDNIERTVGGVRFNRSIGLENGRATARSSARQVALEIPRSEAVASNALLTEIAQGVASATGTPGTMTRSDRAALAGREPVSANDFVDRGYTFLQAGNLDSAAADFERAAALRPDWSRPLANQAIIQLRRRNYDEAEAFAARAAALDADDFVVSQARGGIQLARDKPVQAVAALTRSLELEPGNSFSLAARAAAYERLGEFDDALADYATIIERNPGHPGALVASARIHAWRNDQERAIAAIDAVAPITAEDPLQLLVRGRLLRSIGRDEAAAQAFHRALALVDARPAEPARREANQELRREVLTMSGDIAGAASALNAAIVRRPRDAGLLNERCWLRATANVELSEALADCDRAIALAPDSAAILDSRALVKLRLGRIDGAIEDADAALSRSPDLAASLYVRGIARLRRGDRAAGDRDLAAARRLVFDIDAEYRRFGVTP